MATVSRQDSPERRRRGAAPAVFAAAAVVVAAAAVIFTWSRLFVGVDLLDESYYILVPWRWVLGARPFVEDQNLLQLAGLLEYPFLKLFGLLRDNDPTGLVLYTRHLYLLLMVGVAAAAFLLLRRLVRWEFALVIASVVVSYIFWATPQLSYNSMGIAFLTLAAVLGAWVVVLGKSRAYAVGSGAALACAVVAYPTLLFIVPYVGVFLALAHGRRAVAAVAHGAFDAPPDPAGQPTGKAAWRTLSAWALGGALVLVPVGLLLLSFGLQNVRGSVTATLSGSHTTGQLGGAGKAVAVARGIWNLATWQPLVLVAALVAYLVYRRRPRLGRVLLAALPLVLWFAAQRPLLGASGYAQAYVFFAPYLFLFVPREKREAGAKLLIWIWAPSLVAGAMTAYSSAFGYVNATVGLAPSVLVSGLFLAWALEAVWGTAGDEVIATRSRAATSSAWLALAVLAAVVAVTISFQFQFQQRAMRYGDLTSRLISGPWAGIKASPERRELMDGFAADLRAQTRPGDDLLIFPTGTGFYLYWTGSIAADSSWLIGEGPDGRLSPATVEYFRRTGVVPSLVVHLLPTAGMTEAELQAACGGLDYPPTLVRPTYAFQRRPADESATQVLARLRRE